MYTAWTSAAACCAAPSSHANLASVLVLRSISTRVLKRFPTMEHVVHAGASRASRGSSRAAGPESEAEEEPVPYSLHRGRFHVPGKEE